MANYPNYYPNQNPTYQPMYGQQFQNYQPQFQQQNMMQPQMQMPQQQVQQMPNTLSTRFVDDFNSLSANDVPMDGYGAVFVKRDSSEIQWRNWAANGTIVTTSYKPILEQNIQEGTNMQQTDLNALYEDVKGLRRDISEWINELVGKIDSLEKSMTNPTTKTSSSKVKKEVTDNE